MRRLLHTLFAWTHLLLMCLGPLMALVVVFAVAGASVGLFAWHWACYAVAANLTQVYLFFGLDLLLEVWPSLHWSRVTAYFKRQVSGGN